MATSSDGIHFDGGRELLEQGSLFEIWHPRVVIRDDGMWLLYTNIKYTSSESLPSVAVATSTDGGSSFQFVVDPSTGLPQKILGGYRWGSITSQPDGTFLQYATSNSDNTLNVFTSVDGIAWSAPTQLGVWGADAIGARYDATGGYYLITWDPPNYISNDCNSNITNWQYPFISVSPDGYSLSYQSVENYFWGTVVLAAEAAVLGDQKGVIQASTAPYVYMNDQASATYNHPTTNDLFVTNWKRASGAFCP